MKKQKTDPTLNIWQAVSNFKLNKVLVARKGELIFLVDMKDNFLIFANENGQRFNLHQDAQSKGLIRKVF